MLSDMGDIEGTKRKLLNAFLMKVGLEAEGRLAGLRGASRRHSAITRPARPCPPSLRPSAVRVIIPPMLAPLNMRHRYPLAGALYPGH